MRLRVAAILGAVLAGLSFCRCLDLYHDLQDRADAAQYSRHQGLRKVHLAYLAKFYECESLAPGSGKGFFILASSYPYASEYCAEGHSLMRSCEQSQRYVEKSAVDTCVLAIAASPCQAPDGATIGAYGAAFACAAAFDQLPVF